MAQCRDDPGLIAGGQGGGATAATSATATATATAATATATAATTAHCVAANGEGCGLENRGGQDRDKAGDATAKFNRCGSGAHGQEEVLIGSQSGDRCEKWRPCCRDDQFITCVEIG